MTRQYVAAAYRITVSFDFLFQVLILDDSPPPSPFLPTLSPRIRHSCRSKVRCQTCRCTTAACRLRFILGLGSRECQYLANTRRSCSARHVTQQRAAACRAPHHVLPIVMTSQRQSLTSQHHNEPIHAQPPPRSRRKAVPVPHVTVCCRNGLQFVGSRRRVGVIITPARSKSLRLPPWLHHPRPWHPCTIMKL